MMKRNRNITTVEKGSLIKVNGLPFLTDFALTHTETGIDELSFTVYESEPIYAECDTEITVQYHNQRFSIKSINDNGKYSIIDCRLDLVDFEFEPIKEIGTDDEKVELTITEIFETFLPKTWTYHIENEHEATNEWNAQNVLFLDVLKECCSIYGVYYAIDNVHRHIEVKYISDVEYSGNYVTDQLNIISNQMQSDTYELCTRLYAYGRDEQGNELTFASINDGKEYIDDFSYTDKIISRTIVENDINTAEDLLERARTTLKKMSVPASSYSFKVSRLKDIDDYALKDISIHQLVKYLDRKRRKEVMHEIVKYVEHPNDPSVDEITLATTAETIEDQVSNISSSVSSSSLNSTASREALAVIKNYFGTGFVRADSDKILAINKLPIDEATGCLMLDKFGLWWNNRYEPHTLDEDGKIEKTTWRKLIDINTGKITST